MRPRTEFETRPLLTFRDAEDDFRQTVELARPYSLDLALFGVHAAMVSTGVGYILKGGAPPIAIISTAVAVLVLSLSGLLYIAPRSSPQIAKTQRSLRVPLHMLAEVLSTILYVTCSHKSRASVCSPLWGDYTAIEGFLAHLVWPATYPALTAMPLSLAMPLQVVVCAIYMSHNSSMCSMFAQACPKAEQQYQMLQRHLRQLFSGMPLNAPSRAPVPYKIACTNVLMYFEIMLLCVFFFFFTFMVEHASRHAYSLATGKRRLQGELRRRRPALWLLVGELIVAGAVTWNAIAVWNDIYLIMRSAY